MLNLEKPESHLMQEEVSENPLKVNVEIDY